MERRRFDEVGLTPIIGRYVVPHGEPPAAHLEGGSETACERAMLPDESPVQAAVRRARMERVRARGESPVASAVEGKERGDSAAIRGGLLADRGEQPTSERNKVYFSAADRYTTDSPVIGDCRACDVVHSSDLVDHEADLPRTGDAHDALRRPTVLA
ncbi:hypothetical protein T492DRAFT_905031 [Pavlovales sp. CCMP2436]|nr:hypothetical protein T492DRAFT_905031 [Pavlovales sp. CCMP2436]